MIPGVRRCGRRLVSLALAVILAAPSHAQTPASDSVVAALRGDVDRFTTAKNWPALVEALTRLRTVAEGANDTLLEAETLRRLGLAHQQLKASDQARAEFEAALAIHAARGDRVSSGQLRDDLGFLAFAIEDWPGVRSNFAAAADQFAAAGLPERQVNSLRNSTFARDLSVDDRIAIIERAWLIADRSAGALVKGLVRHQLGDLLVVRGEYDRAIEEVEAAVPLLESDKPKQAAALTSLGRIYRLHGLPDRSIAIYRRVLPLLEQTGDAWGLAQTYDALGVANNAAGRFSEAIVEEERAVEVARRADLRTAIPFYTANLAATLRGQGEFARAAALLEPLLADKPLPEFEKLARQTLAGAYRGLGRLDAARVEIDKAVAICATTNDREQMVGALTSRAQIRRDLNDLPSALADATHALDLLEALRANAPPRDALKQGFVDQHRDLFALAIALQRDSHDAAGAFDTAERARARAFQDLLATRDLAAGPARAPAGAELPSGVVVPPVRVAGLRNAVRDANTTLLAYWVAPEETTVWVISRSGTVTTARVPVKASRYEELTRQVWHTSSGPVTTTTTKGSHAPIDLLARSGTRLTLGGDPRAALRELYQLLIAPIEASLPSTEASLLTIVPHGPLFGVPFAALTDARNTYLVETYRLHYLASAALLQQASHVTTAGRGVLLVADPSPMPASSPPLAALPGARAEVRALARLLPKNSTTVLVGPEATESRVRAASGGQRAVHLATHGMVFDDRPFDSFLALAPESSLGSDGRLTTSEVYGLQLNADVVVLSGCRTATGQLSGDGVQGLARAFFYAGTPSVVATLWDLPDAPAQYLFPEFFRKWIAGESRSAALRDAQLSLIRALRRGAISVTTPLGAVKLPEHPAVWASPVLLGQP